MLTIFFHQWVKSGITLLITSVVLLSSFGTYAQNLANRSDHIHGLWHTLLNKNVVTIPQGDSTQVNYAAIKDHHNELTLYLDNLSTVTLQEFNAWNNSKQLAFLINAYNAWTVAFILTKYPDLESIKDLGSFFSSPWSKKFIPLLGKTHSLDNIEHDLIRGAVDGKGKAIYPDPRIHFAVNCASIGCPALREEAYTSEQLEQQLEAQTVRFLSDTTRNFVQGNTLNVSSIFKWYREDFEQGYKNTHTLAQFMLLYAKALQLTPEQTKALRNGKMKIKFLDYDWDLNAQQ